MNSDRYQKQDRGNKAAYEAYFAGMDASVQQKIALTAAHFPTSGKVADMGCGSGRAPTTWAASTRTSRWSGSTSIQSQSNEPRKCTFAQTFALWPAIFRTWCFRLRAWTGSWTLQYCITSRASMDTT